MAHRRVPGDAAVEARAPGDRVVVVGGVAVLLAVGRLVDGREHLHVAGARAEVGDRRAAVDGRRRRVLEVVPLVHARPGGGQAGGRGLVGVLDLDGRGRRSGRVRAEVAADQLAVPRPRVLGVGRRVDAGVAAAGLDEALERRLLRVVEHLAGRREEHDDVVVREVRVGELRGVLGRGHGEAVGRARAAGSRRSPAGSSHAGTRPSWRRRARSRACPAPGRARQRPTTARTPARRRTRAARRESGPWTIPLPLQVAHCPPARPLRAVVGRRNTARTTCCQASEHIATRTEAPHLLSDRSTEVQEYARAARWRSTTRAQRRPSAIAVTTSDWPIRASPAANTPWCEVS